MDRGATEPEVNSEEIDTPPEIQEHFAYDIRTDEIYIFRRMNKYILLQTIPFGALLKIDLEEFDEFFDGIPDPRPPYIVRIK